MLVAVDVVGSHVWCSADEVDFDLAGSAFSWVMGFVPVVAVGWFASGFVNPDKADVTGFEEPVEVGATKGSVVGVANQAIEVFGCLEVLVDNEVSFAHAAWSDRVDGEDYLLVPLVSSKVGECVGEPGDDFFRLRWCVIRCRGRGGE